ncbi:NAD(P)/FAD-dependent oxidoreductase [Rhodobacteraceae bacterium 2CG4]|uniref:NAD(P)/FAD-dependent oxidoreductase n=1 Tax=Halovulum marinum TaxID=2662447 RepID=A0A6L5YZP2_9RHOB|nr:NAD(P)/FAD-dependent oxidoreductase [Halovulum marinum]MSU89204.1 NAD(P)/FAD-dependent oxidoreductase [Halovulum marinum]
MYDVAIVGARCAGSALALMLARAGAKVLVIDRTTFPSDTMSGHYIQPAGISCLRRLGLIESLAALGYPPQETISVDFGRTVVAGRPAPMPDGTAVAYAPRRHRFDPMLADAAVAAGAELREATSFVEPLLRDGRVIGLRTSAGGRTNDVHARLVVGADGKRSRVARTVGAESYETAPARTCAYYTYWEGAAVASARLLVRDGLFAVAVPCGEGRTFLALQWPRHRFAEVRRDIDAATRTAVAGIPWLAARFGAGRPAERYIGTGDLDSFLRTASGPGWALVGDAGHHKDPITAQGMTDALLDAELLAAAVLAGLGGGRDLDAALRDYVQARDRRALPMHRVTADLARLVPPPPAAQEEMAAMAGDPIAAGRFLGVMAGSVAPEEIFGPAAERAA